MACVAGGPDPEGPPARPSSSEVVAREDFLVYVPTSGTALTLALMLGVLRSLRPAPEGNPSAMAISLASSTCGSCSVETARLQGCWRQLVSGRLASHRANASFPCAKPRAPGRLQQGFNSLGSAGPGGPPEGTTALMAAAYEDLLRRA